MDSAEARRRLVQDVEQQLREHVNDRSHAWSMLVHSDYDAAFEAIRSVPRGDGFFLEWGSGLGTITLMAAMLGYTASGIEIWPELVDIANALAVRYGLEASMVVGTFIPDWYEENPHSFDPDMRSDFAGEDGYRQLGLDLRDFDVIYGFPWPGQEDLFLDLFRRGAKRGAHLIRNLGSDGMSITRHR